MWLWEGFKSDPSDLIRADTAQYRSAEECWRPATPPSPALLDQEEDEEWGMNNLDLNHALLEMPTAIDTDREKRGILACGNWTISIETQV